MSTRSKQKRFRQIKRANVSPFGQQTLSFQGKEPKKLKNLMMLLLFQQALSVAIELDDQDPSDSDLSEKELIKEVQDKLMATMKTKLDLPKEDIEALVRDSSDWDSTTVADLAKLLSDGLHKCIHNAIKKIIESGYTKEVAEYAILRCGPFYGIKDMVSSIVDRALNCLKTKGFHDATLHTFQDLNSLVEYMMLEMVTLLRDIKPSLSVREAMWTLLICDLNVLDACEADIDQQKFSIGGLKSVQEEGTSAKVEPEPEPEPEHKAKHEPPSNPGKRIEDECTCSKTSSSEHKRATIRQKTFHAEKSYKGRASKVVLKAKLGKWSDLSSTNKKNSALPLKETEQKAKVTTPKVETVPPEPPKTADYYLAGIPYDETKGEYVPQDEKDEMIMAAVGQLQLLQKEVKSWDDWANVKVMQVAKRLSQDRIELNKLKAEKVEAEKINKDKQVMEESTTKKLSEITVALNASNCQIQMASSAIVRLESEKSVVKQERKIAEKQSFIEAKKLEEAMCKEREALKKSESFRSEKNLLEEELKSLKREAAPKQRDVEKAKCLLRETETRLAKEQRETVKFLEPAEILRNERERLEALAKEENERASAKAELDFKKYETEINRIRYEIAAMNLEAEAKEIAAMRMGMNSRSSEGTLTSEVSRKEFKHGITSRNKDRECVMCLTEEMTVVFVPCGHQVVCAECNLIHEQNGMKDCPSCRTPIQKRITARFAKS